MPRPEIRGLVLVVVLHLVALLARVRIVRVRARRVTPAPTPRAAHRRQPMRSASFANVRDGESARSRAAAHLIIKVVVGAIVQLVSAPGAHPGRVSSAGAADASMKRAAAAGVGAGSGHRTARAALHLDVASVGRRHILLSDHVRHERRGLGHLERLAPGGTSSRAALPRRRRRRARLFEFGQSMAADCGSGAHGDDGVAAAAGALGHGQLMDELRVPHEDVGGARGRVSHDRH